MTKITPFEIVATKDTSREASTSCIPGRFAANGRTWIWKDLGGDHASPRDGKQVVATNGVFVDLDIEESACFGARCQSSGAVSVLSWQQASRKIDRRVSCVSGMVHFAEEVGDDASVGGDASVDERSQEAEDDDTVAVGPPDSRGHGRHTLLRRDGNQHRCSLRGRCLQEVSNLVLIEPKKFQWEFRIDRIGR